MSREGRGAREMRRGENEGVGLGLQRKEMNPLILLFYSFILLLLLVLLLYYFVLFLTKVNGNI